MEQEIENILLNSSLTDGEVSGITKELLNLHSVSNIIRDFEEWRKKYPLVNLEEPEWQLKRFLSEYYR